MAERSRVVGSVGDRVSHIAVLGSMPTARINMPEHKKGEGRLQAGMVGWGGKVGRHSKECQQHKRLGKMAMRQACRDKKRT